LETETTVHGSMDLPVGVDWDRLPDGRAENDHQTNGDHRSEDDNRTSDDHHQQAPHAASQPDQQDSGEQDRIPARLERWKEKLKRELGLDKSFEVQIREMPFGEHRIAFLFLSVFMKDATMVDVLKQISWLDPATLSHEAMESYLTQYVPAMQVKKTESFNEMIGQVLMGDTAFYIDGQPAVLMIDAKQFPARNPEQPALEKVVRGSKDGFTETLLMNVGLVRRRLRDGQARFEMMKVGERTQTDVCIGYLADVANPKLVESVRDKIKKVKIDGIPLADKQLEEMMLKKNWSPFPLVRYTERPDVVSAQLLDGSVAILTDTSPSAMLLPTTVFDLVQHAEESRENPFMGTYLRWVRFIGILASMFLMPIWYMYAQNTALRPDWLWFVGAHEAGVLPLILQFVIAELGVDMIRLAAIHTPAPLVTAMTLLSAILIGDIAVKTGLFINEVILYMSVSAIGMFATPSYELGLANRIVRLGLLLAVFLFKAPGFIVGTTLLVVLLAMERSFNTPYMWPLIPFNGPALLSVLLRRPMPANKMRPSLNRPLKSRKQPT